MFIALHYKLIYIILYNEKIENVKPNFLKKIFVKLCRIVSFEIVEHLYYQFRKGLLIQISLV